MSIFAAVPMRLITTGTASLLLSFLSMIILAFDCRDRDLIVSPFRPTKTLKTSSTHWLALWGYKCWAHNQVVMSNLTMTASNVAQSGINTSQNSHTYIGCNRQRSLIPLPHAARGSGLPPNRVYLGPTRVSTLKRTSIHSAIFVECSCVTHRQTD